MEYCLKKVAKVRIQKEVYVKDLLEDNRKLLSLNLLAGERGLVNSIKNPRIQKPGLAFAGYLKQLHKGRVQVIGNTEISYLSTLSCSLRDESIKNVCKCDIACFIITTALCPPDTLLSEAEQRDIPVIISQKSSAEVIKILSNYLEEKLCPELTVHGVLMDIFGVGMLILGKSGIGKSETALKLLMKGHKLVSDDVVVIKLRGVDRLVGESPDITRSHIEVRGLGILNVKDIFGISVISEKKKVDMVVELVEWSEWDSSCRIGEDKLEFRILDIPVPYVSIPVASGRDIATILEVAAKKQLLQARGLSPEREFERKLLKQLGRETSSS